MAVSATTVMGASLAMSGATGGLIRASVETVQAAIVSSMFLFGIFSLGMYRGLVRETAERKRAEEALRRARDELELRVDERTAELRGVNESLRHEIEERKRAEEALRESEERFRTLYTRTPVMLYSIDAGGRIVAVSDHWLEVLGYQRDEVIGRKSVEFLTPESRQYAETVTLPEFWKTFCARDVPYQFVKKNGEIIDVLLSAVGERDADGKFERSLAVLIDVTEQKRLEEALQSAREELEGKVERELLRRNP